MTTQKEVDAALVRATQEEIAASVARHNRMALNFSGGKDSLACLYLLRPYWDRLVVLWGNAGDSYPETREIMDSVRPLVAEFHEIVGNVPLHTVYQGFPCDMVPAAATPVGRQCEASEQKFTVQSRYDCCWSNVWLPVLEATRALGINLLIKGQRDSESKRTPIYSGYLDADGREHLLPLQKWSSADVFAFLRAEGVAIPRQYAYGMNSLDCMHCTGYLDESRSKLRYLREFHPGVAVEYERRLRLIKSAQEREYRMVQISLGELEPVGAEGLPDSHVWSKSDD